MSGRLFTGCASAVLAAGLLFAGGEPPVGGSFDVVARDCRVTFVERRTLAVEHPGILSEAVREGERVEVGQVVLRVRDAVPKSALAVAAARADSDADVRAAEKEREAAEFEYQTHLKARAGTYTDIEIRRVQLAAESAVLKAEQAMFERDVNRRLRDQAADELGTYYVPSTISGLVTRAFKGAGEAVQLGEPILEVVNTEKVRVEGFVPLAEAWRVEVGTPITARVDLSGRDHELLPDREAAERETVVTLRGELGFVDVDVQPLAKVVRVWAEFPNPGNRLRDGLTAQEMTIHTSGGRPTAASR